MALPINPPVMPYMLRDKLVNEPRWKAEFVEPNLVKSLGFWFWSYEDRKWFAGPYRSKRAALVDRARYLKLTEGEALRCWATS